MHARGALPYEEAYSISLGPPPDERETVVIVPPKRSLAAGFSECKRLLAARQGGPVRMVATGATVERYHPPWVRTCDGPLRLTELDVYLPRERAALLSRILPTLDAWLDRVLADAVPGLRPSAVFGSIAHLRLFGQLCDDYLLACGLAERHAHDQMVSIDQRWNGLAISQALKGEQPSSAARTWTPAHAAAFAAVGVAALAQRARTFVAEAPSRRKLAALRAGEHSGAGPRIWIAVVGSWPRACRAVTETIPPLVRAANEPLGVLLQGSLEPGLHTTPFWTSSADTDDILPTLALPELDGLVSAVDQGISAESTGELLRVFADATSRWPRIAASAARSPLTLNIAGQEIPIALPTLSLAKLLTVDVLRAREALHASERLTARRRFDGASLAWAHENLPGDVVVDQILQRAGAETMEVMHGIMELKQQMGYATTTVKTKAFWSIPEAEAVAPHRPGQRCVGGYFPRAVPPPFVRPALAPDEPIRVLIASNYLVSAWGLDVHTYEPYQAPLLREAILAQQHFPLELRWRPHPGDDPKLLAEVTRAFPEIPRSPGGDLDDDLRWCRVLVTSVSSCALEALFFGVPVFVQEVPIWDDTWFRVFDRARLFGRDRSLGEVLRPCLAELRAGDTRALAPEKALTQRLFGPGGYPRSTAELLWPDSVPAGGTVVADPGTARGS